MDEQKICEWLVLQQIKGLGLKKLHQFLAQGHTTASLFTLPQEVLNSLPGPIKQDLSSIQSQAESHPYFQKAREIQSHVKAKNWAIIAIDNPEYPALLREIPFAPPLLYVKGKKEVLHSNQLAIVGARKASQMAVNISYQWSKDIATQGISITSGLALGVDGSAHRGALAGKGKTIAVLAHGLDQVYPKTHRRLADSIVEDGALVTEFAPDMEVRRDHFPRRNRIISGLSLGVLVVEAAVKSGSLITAQYALEQNRDVFAVPGSISNPMAKGCHLLIKQGAQLTETVADILECYPVSGSQQLPLLGDASVITDILTRVLSVIPYDFTHFDEIFKVTGKSVSELNSALMELEVMGYVDSQSGSFRRIK